PPERADFLFPAAHAQASDFNFQVVIADEGEDSAGCREVLNSHAVAHGRGRFHPILNIRVRALGLAQGFENLRVPLLPRLAFEPGGLAFESSGSLAALALRLDLRPDFGDGSFPFLFVLPQGLFQARVELLELRPPLPLELLLDPPLALLKFALLLSEAGRFALNLRLLLVELRDQRGSPRLRWLHP